MCLQSLSDINAKTLLMDLLSTIKLPYMQNQGSHLQTPCWEQTLAYMKPWSVLKNCLAEC